jgi:hypothetical protein
VVDYSRPYYRRNNRTYVKSDYQYTQRVNRAFNLDKAYSPIYKVHGTWHGVNVNAATAPPALQGLRVGDGLFHKRFNVCEVTRANVIPHVIGGRRVMLEGISIKGDVNMFHRPMDGFAAARVAGIHAGGDVDWSNAFMNHLSVRVMVIIAKKHIPLASMTNNVLFEHPEIPHLSEVRRARQALHIDGPRILRSQLISLDRGTQYTDNVNLYHKFGRPIDRDEVGQTMGCSIYVVVVAYGNWAHNTHHPVGGAPLGKHNLKISVTLRNTMSSVQPFFNTGDF